MICSTGKEGNPLEKRRIRLEINGVVCGLITQESEEYMQKLAEEVGKLMQEVLDASPFVTREAAALTAALGYCDDAKKNAKKAFQLQERIDELEVEAEIWQEDRERILAETQAQAGKADSLLQEKITSLEEENAALQRQKAEYAVLQKEMQAVLQDKAGLEEQVRSYEAAQDESRQVSQELLEELRELREENGRLRESAAAEEKAGDSRIEELSRKIDELQEEKKQLEAVNEKIEEEKAQFREAAQRVVEEAKLLKQRTEEKMKRAEERADKLAAQLIRKEQENSRVEKKEETASILPRFAVNTGEHPAGTFRNPLRHEELDQQGLVSFFEKK
jgi:chromosome segregation ATPase